MPLPQNAPPLHAPPAAAGDHARRGPAGHAGPNADAGAGQVGGVAGVGPSSPDAEHRVRLEAFDGPLDLLLFLIRKHEIDIHDIPIARITEQYLASITDLAAREGAKGRLDIDAAGEFLVMAATLTEIKARMLQQEHRTPAPAAGAAHATRPPPAAEDPRAELVRQLLEYKTFRDAADLLESRADTWRRRFAAAPARPDADAPTPADVEIDDLDLVDLVEAFRRIADTVNFDRLGEHQVTYDDTPIELHARDLLDRLERETTPRTPDLGLATLLSGRTRGQLVGLFLATLELVRRREITLRLDREAGTVSIRRRTPEELAADPPTGTTDAAAGL